MVDRLRDVYTRWRHLFRVRRQEMADAWLRLRTRRARPSRMAGLWDRLLTRWRGLWPRMAHPLGSLRRRARTRVQVVQDLAAPLAAAAENSGNTNQWRSRWWDPLALWLRTYFVTRPGRDSRRGLPALSALVVCAGVALVVTGLRPAATRYTNLLAAAELAMANRDYPKALIAYERMLQVGHVDAATQFSLAKCLAALGEYQRANQVLYALAPDDATGYLPAHRVRAYLILQSPQATAGDLVLARRHLERVLAANPDDDEAHGLMASALLRQEDVQGARDEFVRSTGSRPDMALNAAMLSREVGDARGVADNAAQAAAYFQGEIAKAGNDVPATDVLSLAQALCLQQKYRDAIDVLESYLDRSDRPQLVGGILRICTVWQQEIERRHGPEDLDRLFIAQCVLTHQPQAHDWQLKMLDLAGEGSLVRPAALKFLEQLAQDKNAGPEVCFVLGMEALRHEDYAAARAYLARSNELLPGHWPTVNNLACALLAGPNPEPARALELADQLVKAAPHDPRFRETRGEALLALGRWSDAAAELEAALPALDDRRQAHAHLAQAYDQLGQPDKAQPHRAAALTDQPP